MEYEVTINGRMPGLNEFIDASRRNRYASARMKSENMELCKWQIRAQLPKTHITKKVRIHYLWYESNAKRDLDNVAGFGHKIIQDALVHCGVIDNDGWKNVVGFTDTFAIDREHPRIVVLIEEVNDAEE